MYVCAFGKVCLQYYSGVFVPRLYVRTHLQEGKALCAFRAAFHPVIEMALLVKVATDANKICCCGFFPSASLLPDNLSNRWDGTMYSEGLSGQNRSRAQGGCFFLREESRGFHSRKKETPSLKVKIVFACQSFWHDIWHITSEMEHRVWDAFSLSPSILDTALLSCPVPSVLTLFSLSFPFSVRNYQSNEEKWHCFYWWAP